MPNAWQTKITTLSNGVLHSLTEKLDTEGLDTGDKSEIRLEVGGRIG